MGLSRHPSPWLGLSESAARLKAADSSESQPRGRVSVSLSLSLSHGDVCSVCMHTSFLFRESFCFRFGRAQVVTARIFLEIWAKFIEISNRKGWHEKWPWHA